MKPVADIKAILDRFPPYEIKFTSNYIVDSLRDMASQGTLVLSPDFQRNFVWDAKKQSNLIMSLMLNSPIDTVYVWEREDGRYEVVDGQQRLTTMLMFMGTQTTNVDISNGLISPNFALSFDKDSEYHELNGCKFSDLPYEYKNKIKRYNVTVVCLHRDNPMQQITQFFNVKNCGVSTLNKSELRMSTSTGPLSRLLNEISKNETLKALYRKNYKTHLNKKYVQEQLLKVVVSFCDVRDGNIVLNPNKEVVQSLYNPKYLDAFLKSTQRLEMEQLGELKSTLLACLDMCSKTFGEGVAWTVFDTTKNGFRAYTQQSLLIAQMKSFLPFVIKKKRQYFASEEAKESIMALLSNFMRENQTSLTGRAKETRHIAKLINVWDTLMKETYPVNMEERRFFTKAEKEYAYNLCGGVCAITGLTYKIEDMEADHIIPYAKGGTTTLDNCQMISREENRHKGSKMPVMEEALSA
jgi:hypothetical protein